MVFFLRTLKAILWGHLKFGTFNSRMSDAGFKLLSHIRVGAVRSFISLNPPSSHIWFTCLYTCRQSVTRGRVIPSPSVLQMISCPDWQDLADRISLCVATPPTGYLDGVVFWSRALRGTEKFCKLLLHSRLNWVSCFSGNLFGIKRTFWSKEPANHHDLKTNKQKPLSYANPFIHFRCFFQFLLSYWEQKSVYLSVWFMQICNVQKAGNMCFVLFLD